MRCTWIFAYRHEGHYHPEEIVVIPEDSFANLEYGDVKEGEYQLWEYPSGKIFSIVPDRELSEQEDPYATPNNAAANWQPKLVELNVDKEKVSAAYAALNSA